MFFSLPAAAQESAEKAMTHRGGQGPESPMGAMMHGCLMKSKMTDHLRRTGNFSDRGYLSAMVVHHEAALDMARREIAEGRDAQVKLWAEAIVSDQQKEIDQMRGWLKELGGEDPEAAKMMDDSMKEMMNMAKEGDPDAEFVSMMIGHHAGAVEMAVGAVIGSADRRVIELSRNIINSQLDEIIDYKKWLSDNGRKLALAAD